MRDLESVYEQVMEHFHSCQPQDGGVSDIWRHTLQNYSGLYSLEEFKGALAPGTRIGYDFTDFNCYVDQSVLDFENAITAKILEFGQDDFGRPLKDLRIGGEMFSSRYISDIVRATKIISRLEDSSVNSPRVMEIGGGAAGLLHILKRYYGERVTLFAVDLPEILMVQEWLLRNWFPNVPHTFKSSQQDVEFVIGGMNFINAYVHRYQNTQVDVLINVNSMHEMDSVIANGYLQYAAHNLSPNGFVYFENRFGHGNGSAIEPTEYSLDTQFTTLYADILSDVDTFGSGEFFHLVLGRTSFAEDVETRRFVHRLLWNGFNSRILPRNQGFFDDLKALPKDITFTDCTTAAQQVLDKHNVLIDESELKHLCNYPHWDSSFFIHSSGDRLNASGARNLSINDFSDAIWAAQSSVNSLMHEIISSPGAWSVDAAAAKVKEICEGLISNVTNVEESELKSARIACFLMPLGEVSRAKDILMECGSRTRQDYWLIRFARLSSLFGFKNEARSMLENIDGLDNLNAMFLSEVADIRYSIGDHSNTKQILNDLAKEIDCLSQVEVAALARACVKSNNYELARTVFAEMRHGLDSNERQHPLDFLLFASSASPIGMAKEFVSESLDLIEPYLKQPKDKLRAGVLKHMAGVSLPDTNLIHDGLGELPDDYYSRGWAGMLLMSSGVDELAAGCLNRSLALRPANFMHSEFIGNSFYHGGHWSEASKVFDNALRIVPYVRSVWARKLYCELPDSYKKCHTFSDPVGLNMVFHDTQVFYSDILPSNKPRRPMMNRQSMPVAD